jgi:hypothetical protein
MVRKSDWRQKDREGSQKKMHEPTMISEIIVGNNGRWSIETGGEFDNLASANVQVTSVSAINKIDVGWSDLAIMSWDGLLRPVAKLNGAGSELPQYAVIQAKSESVVPTGDEEPELSENTSVPKSAQPPFIYGATAAKESYYLDLINSFIEPMTNSEFEHYGIQSGHDVDMIARFDECSIAEDFSLSRQVEQSNGYIEDTDDVRFMALRGPLVITGWGFDTDGKPIPNKADDMFDAAGGNFVDSGLKLVRAKMTSKTQAYQTEGCPLYDDDGNTIPFGDQIRLEVREESGLDSGDDVILYYSYDDNKYWNLGGGGGEGVAIPLDLVKVGGSQGDSTSKPSWTYDVFDARERNDAGRAAIATAVDPTEDPHQWVRHLGQMTIADFGWGWYNPDNELEVTWINEILIAAACESGCDTGCESGDDSGGESRALTGIASSIRTESTSPVVLTDQDHIVLLDANATPIQVDLPPAAAHVGGQYFIKKVDASSNNVTIQPNGLELVDGASSDVLTTQYQSSTIVSDGSGWFKIS